MINRRSLMAYTAAAAATVSVAGRAMAQLAAQPMRIVFPFTAGGSGDALARLLADKLRIGLDQPVLVDNRTGAAGRIGVQAVKSAAPDGKTLLLTPIAPVAVYQHVYRDLGYDPIKDLMPISQVSTMDFALAVGPSLPVKSVKELVAWCKANPAQANYGTPGAGTLPHFFMVLVGQAAGIDLQHVSYKGSAGAIADLAGGQLPMVLSTTPDLMSLHKAGKIRVIATSGTARSPFLPDVPTFIESGYKIQGDTWYGMFAPAGTPVEVIKRLSDILIAALKTPELRDKLSNLGLQPTGTSAEELRTILQRDSAAWAPAVAASGFKPEN
ncbi:MAG: Bug family tripartite tricarboxylate transporter substrate binding protein [Ferrovibrio sp.]|uniref:Bug family tripartite tricarboxylate transporter substrate binding protein n=1 Tax=Ferrovibrio sp. TaxID=1917215 RepID=UPI002639B388|nr:Bug family tripartite tricarboxylate transporter substrate binding protein [Ferrovibrio sp.]MCW0232122.1 Bug family tripartite tricarboxylate transporter substrate binding protein [Ferrovibrio sp.]